MSTFKVQTTIENYGEVVRYLRQIDPYIELVEYASGKPLYVFNDVREQKDNACLYLLRQLEKRDLLKIIED